MINCIEIVEQIQALIFNCFLKLFLDIATCLILYSVMIHVYKLFSL